MTPWAPVHGRSLATWERNHEGLAWDGYVLSCDGQWSPFRINLYLSRNARTESGNFIWVMTHLFDAAHHCLSLIRNGHSKGIPGPTFL